MKYILQNLSEWVHSLLKGLLFYNFSRPSLLMDMIDNEKMIVKPFLF